MDCQTTDCQIIKGLLYEYTLLLNALSGKTQLAANQFLVKTLVTGDDSEIPITALAV